MGDIELTSAELDELERLAKAATPGPWFQTGAPWFRDGSGVLAGSPDGNVAYLIADTDDFGLPRDEYEGFPLGDKEDDAAYIASANPATILRLLSLARAGIEAGKAEEWLPIETAPKDGTEIILGSEPQMFNGQPVPARVTIGHWTTDEECRVDIGDCGGDCHCREYEYVDPSWISWDGGFTPENPPTHWRPPPAPPAIRALPLTGVDK